MELAFGRPGLPANLHLARQEWAGDLVDMVNPVAAPSLLVVVLLLSAGTAAADPQPDPGNGHQGEGNNGNGNGNDGTPGDNGNHGGGDNGNHAGEGQGSGGGNATAGGNATSDGDAKSAQITIQDHMSCPLFRADPRSPGEVILDPNGCYRETINRALGVPPVQLILKRLP